MSTAAIATTTTNNKRASKRFSFAGFSLFNKSNNNTNNFDSKDTTTAPVEENKSQPPSTPSQEDVSNDDERKRRRRAQKSQSLYLQSFRNLTSNNNNKSRPTSTQYDPAEVQQANHKEVRSSIRRSLSAVLYATPQSKQQQQSGGSAGLVPVLVTQDLSDRHGGMITSDDIEKKQEQTVKKKKEKSVEYDNTLDIITDSKDNQLVIIWQGYGYLHSMKKKDKKKEGEEQQQQQQQQKELADNDVLLNNTKENLDNRFEKEIWSGYRGLVHPLHLFQDNPENETETQEKWASLSVDELRRYFDNYGSMLLKLRDASMKRQQRQYLVMNDKTKEDWIIPQANEIPSSPTSI
ncbi:hypothetical protein INT45_006157 [Circinella minor]|uniref:Uncharacterized protein n=1 Tax=Circinella minor TaxID=1195481 RepID=A0A8H7RZY9_9FUNG|nr:hypothetical protein INT45_006157 [Circinella minor]